MTTAPEGPRPRPLGRLRSVTARHPHVALLAGVLATLLTEPAVQAGREAASNAEYVGAAAGLGLRAVIAFACLLVAWEGQRRLRLTPVLLCAALLGLGWLLVHLVAGVDPDQDLDFYAEDGALLLEGSYPRSEYPTAAVGLFALETWLGGEPPRVVHALLMLAFHLVAVVAIWSLRTSWSSWLAAFVAVWPLNLFHWEFRYDLASTAFLAGALALAARQRWASSGAALGIGAALKWSPALALGPLLAWLIARRCGRAAASLAAAGVAAFALATVPALVWDPAGVLSAYEQQGDRGVTGESVWYLPLALVGQATAGVHPSDDAGVADVVDVGVTLLQLGLLAVFVLLGARAPTRGAAIALAALAPAAFLLTNRVFSSQFLVLLVAVWAFGAALVVISAREQLAVGAAMAAASFANALVHPYTVPLSWQAASAATFVVGIALTAWLARSAFRARASVEPG